MERIYLDHQAATPVLLEVFEAMRPYFVERFGAPASFHQEGLQAREALQKAREQAAWAMEAESPEEILFTSGGTESINLAVKGTAYANQRRGRHLIATQIDHPAVLQSLEFLESQGFAATRIPVDREGRVDPKAVEEAMSDQTILVCLPYANHDIGAIQPIEEVATVTSDRGIPLFVDATYGGGWLPLSVQKMGPDLVALAPHRYYGPKGVGILYRHRRARLSSLLHGGTQEDGRRAGTENIPAIVGAGVASEVAATERERRYRHTAALQQRLWTGLRDQIPQIRLNGPEPGNRRIPTNLNVSIEFIEGEGLTLLLDMQGVAIGAGTACVSRSLEPSYVLAAMGVDPSLALGSVTFSLGKDNTEAEIDRVIDISRKQIEKLRGMSPTWDEFQRGAIPSAIGGRPDSQA